MFTFFLFLTCLHPILYKNNSSGHVNKHSKQLIYETNIFNNFKKFLTIFYSSVNCNFVFSHSFNFTATCHDNPVIHYCILTRYTELIVLVKLKNGFFDSFDYQKL